MQHIEQFIKTLSHGRAYLENGKICFQLPKQIDLAEKCRLAYRWISENAIYTPYTDIECGTHLTLRQGGQSVGLASGASYSSFILLPLLTLMASRRLLLIGAPGRGKTTIATLMAFLAGYSIEKIHHTVQHGHPQMTQNDLLGSPLPSNLVNAISIDDINVLWRDWIRMRVKIIDEYNRIPTKTQSSLLSLMAEGYAEMYEKIIYSGQSAWFLTANDDLGGGTFPVIEALKDRIDIVVRCTAFDPHYLSALAQRIEKNKLPEDFLPADIIFSHQELDTIDLAIRKIPISTEIMSFLSYFIAQLDFCQQASTQLEFQNKDTVHLAGKRLGHVCTDDCPLDKYENICTQTEYGVSTRAYLAIIHYIKALAYFRGEAEVCLEDLRQILPWVLHEKLVANQQSTFFHKTQHQVYLTDRVAWIRQLFDMAYGQFIAYAKIREPVALLQQKFDHDFPPNLANNEIEKRCKNIQKIMEKILNKQELNAPVHADLVLLKNMYSQYQHRLGVGEK